MLNIWRPLVLPCSEQSKHMRKLLAELHVFATYTYTHQLFSCVQIPYTCPKAGPRGGDGDACPAGMFIRS